MMAALSANFSLPAAKPPAQKIGVAGWDAKLFGADSAPQLPPAPTVEQLMQQPFPAEVLRFYLTKRGAQPAGRFLQGRAVWSYTLHGKSQDVVIPLSPGDDTGERAAVAAIAAVEGIEPDKARLYVAQVVTANWSDFLRGVAEAQQLRTQPAIPAFMQSLLAQPPAVQQSNTGKSEEPTPATNAGDGAIPSCDCALARGKYFSNAPVQAYERTEGTAAPVVERECEDSQAAERNKADFFLREAGGLLKTRGKEYDRVTGAADDPPQEERSFARVAAAFNAVHDTALTPAQVCHMLALLKQVRLFTAPTFHRDSAADGVAYMALLAEEKSTEA